MLKPFTTLLTLTLFAGAISTTRGQTRYDRSLSLASAEPGDPAVGGDGGVAGAGSSLDAPAGSAELAKRLQNPVASLISVPIQNNFDFGAGTDGDGFQYKATQWTVPLNATVAQLVKIGRLPVQFQVGGRYYAERPEYGPDWGLRFGVSLVFPK